MRSIDIMSRQPDYSDKETSSSDDDSRVVQVADPPKSKPSWHNKKNKTSGQCTGTGVTQQAMGAWKNLSPVETEQMWQI